MQVFTQFQPQTGAWQSDLAWLGVRIVRALVNDGRRVHWHVLTSEAVAPAESSWRALTHGELQAIAEVDDSRLADWLALLAQTRSADRDAVLAVGEPAWWPQAFQGASERIGYLCTSPMQVREALPYLRSATVLWVTDQALKAAVHQLLPDMPVRTMPPVRRHGGLDVTLGQVQSFREALGLTGRGTVFYSCMDSTEAAVEVLQAYVHAFEAGQDVTLVLAAPAVLTAQDGRVLDTHSFVDAAAPKVRRSNAPLPPIVVLAHNLNAVGFELLHAVGDVYLSCRHELDLQALDAAAAGRPVLAGPWSGLQAALGPHWSPVVPEEGGSQTQALAQRMHAVQLKGPDELACAHVQMHLSRVASEAQWVHHAGSQA